MWFEKKVSRKEFGDKLLESEIAIRQYANHVFDELTLRIAKLEATLNCRDGKHEWECKHTEYQQSCKHCGVKKDAFEAQETKQRLELVSKYEDTEFRNRLLSELENKLNTFDSMYALLKKATKPQPKRRKGNK